VAGAAQVVGPLNSGQQEPPWNNQSRSPRQQQQPTELAVTNVMTSKISILLMI
jgi:hypothetical protein